jgi:hypothetical protein
MIFVIRQNRDSGDYGMTGIKKPKVKDNATN